MPLIRFLLIGLASLNSAWALYHFFDAYLRLVIQNVDLLHPAARFDPTPLMAWLAIALISGLGAILNLRVSSREERRAAKKLPPAPIQPAEPEPEPDNAGLLPVTM